MVLWSEPSYRDQVPSLTLFFFYFCFSHHIGCPTFFVLLCQAVACGSIVFCVTQLGIQFNLYYNYNYILHFTFYCMGWLSKLSPHLLSPFPITSSTPSFFGFLLWSLFISSHPHLIWMPYHNSVTLPNHFVFSVFFWFASLEFYYLLQLL